MWVSSNFTACMCVRVAVISEMSLWTDTEWHLWINKVLYSMSLWIPVIYDLSALNATHQPWSTWNLSLHTNTLVCKPRPRTTACEYAYLLLLSGWVFNDLHAWREWSMRLIFRFFLSSTLHSRWLGERSIFPYPLQDKNAKYAWTPLIKTRRMAPNQLL